MWVKASSWGGAFNLRLREVAVEDRGREPVRIEGVLRDARPVRADLGNGCEVEGLTATVAAVDGGYGEAYHVTFPPRRDLDLWVGAVAKAWAEELARRETLAGQLPDWMRPRQGRGELRVLVWGRLRCGKPIPPTGVRPATVLADGARFPGLDAAVVCRAEELWRRARDARAAEAAARGCGGAAMRA